MKIVQEALTYLENVVSSRFDGNIKAAAEFFGVPYHTLYCWIGKKNREPTLKALEPILDKLNVQFAYPDQNIIDYDLVPKVAAKAGAGSSLETSGETLGMYAFRKTFLAREGIHASNSIMLDVVGDSMEPLIRAGDTILVDTSDRNVQDGKTYLVAYGDDLKVKHIFKSPQGLILRSENQRYADVTIAPDELGTYAVVHGRVRWFGRLL